MMNYSLMYNWLFNIILLTVSFFIAIVISFYKKNGKIVNKTIYIYSYIYIASASIIVFSATAMSNYANFGAIFNFFVNIVFVFPATLLCIFVVLSRVLGANFPDTSVDIKLFLCSAAILQIYTEMLIHLTSE